KYIKVSVVVFERAMRNVEHKQEVILLMDRITRLTRAYNLVIPPSGRTLSGGIDPAAFHRPKRFFGAARNIEEGGRFTILETALVDTGSRMDDVIYEAIKGSGYKERHLDSQLANRRIYSSIDIMKSGTRKEELFISKNQLDKMWMIRNTMQDTQEFTERVLRRLKETETNKNFLESIERDMQKGNKK